MLFEKKAFASQAEFRTEFLKINSVVFQIADSLGGHFASEHGIGVQHMEAFSRYISLPNIDSMR